MCDLVIIIGCRFLFYVEKFVGNMFIFLCIWKNIECLFFYDCLDIESIDIFGVLNFKGRSGFLVLSFYYLFRFLCLKVVFWERNSYRNFFKKFFY